MWSFLLKHPLYIPFIILNAWIVYKIIRAVLKDDEDDNDDNDNGGIETDGPDLDLPPGVSLPKDTELVT